MSCRAKDAQYAWRKMEGVSIDGRRWKVDYATKVQPCKHIYSCRFWVACSCLCMASLGINYHATYVRASIQVDMCLHAQEDLKFFGWKIPSDLCTPSPSRSR